MPPILCIIKVKRTVKEPVHRAKTEKRDKNLRPIASQCIAVSKGPEVVSTWFKADVEFLHSSSSSKDEWAFIMDLALTMGINDCDIWTLSRRPRDSICKVFHFILKVQPWIITDSQDAVKVKVVQTIDNNKF